MVDASQVPSSLGTVRLPALRSHAQLRTHVHLRLLVVLGCFRRKVYVTTHGSVESIRIGGGNCGARGSSPHRHKSKSVNDLNGTSGARTRKTARVVTDSAVAPAC